MRHGTIATLAFALILLATTSGAQNAVGSGTIGGGVGDLSGAVLPGVTVERPLTKGRVAVEIEGAEIRFRKMEIRFFT